MCHLYLKLLLQNRQWVANIVMPHCCRNIDSKGLHYSWCQLKSINNMNCFGIGWEYRIYPKNSLNHFCKVRKVYQTRCQLDKVRGTNLGHPACKNCLKIYWAFGRSILYRSIVFSLMCLRMPTMLEINIKLVRIYSERWINFNYKPISPYSEKKPLLPSKSSNLLTVVVFTTRIVLLMYSLDSSPKAIIERFCLEYECNLLKFSVRNCNIPIHSVGHVGIAYSYVSHLVF